jgi:hypothetical protein
MASSSDDVNKKRADNAPAFAPQEPRLLDRVRAVVRVRHYSRRTEEAYVTMIDEVHDHDFRRALENLVADKKATEKSSKAKRFECRLSDRCLDTVIVQLRALGPIAKSAKRRSLKDTHTYWTLTPYGDNVMTRLRAIRRNSDTHEA